MKKQASGAAEKEGGRNPQRESLHTGQRESLSGWWPLCPRCSRLEAKSTVEDVSGGPVVENPPANARDMGSIPGRGRFHMPWGK